tara:strand:+ start:156 stop:368 length:213 start_codon:yes stop_codon:yes gene_type:complete
MATKEIIIDNVTEVRTDKYGKEYRLVYTPREWSVDSETGEVTLKQSEAEFCYQPEIWPHLKPGNKLTVVA